MVGKLCNGTRLALLLVPQPQQRQQHLVAAAVRSSEAARATPLAPLLVEGVVESVRPMRVEGEIRPTDGAGENDQVDEHGEVSEPTHHRSKMCTATCPTGRPSCS